MTPFGKYIDCINCGNELTHISELTFRNPDMVECGFCGQRYEGLAGRIKKRKRAITFVFVVIAIGLLIFMWNISGVNASFFSLIPLLVIYYFALGLAVKSLVRF